MVLPSSRRKAGCWTLCQEQPTLKTEPTWATPALATGLLPSSCSLFPPSPISVSAHPPSSPAEQADS